MKFLILAALVFSTATFAQETLENKLKGLEAAREDALFKWRTEHRKSGKLPDDEYVAYYNQMWASYALDEIDARVKACGRGKPDCVTEEQKEAIKARVRIVTGLMTAKNAWASETGITPKKIEEREAAYNNCAKENKDCDKLPDTDRKTAREGQKDTPVIPGGDAKPKTDVVVTPNGVDAKKFADAKQAAEDALKKEVDDLDKAFSDKHPGWRDKDMTPEVKDFLLSQLNKNLELNLAMSKKLCEQFPGSEACLTDEQIEKLKEENAGSLCFVERKFATKSVEASKHSTEWDELPKPKSCKTLLDKDKNPPKDEPTKEEPKKDEPVEEGDDEKTPRNYKSETCKWVSDLPRKIVNGPGCGGKSRSRICTGYVVCEQKQGGAKFIRMSSCSPDHCGSSDSDAVKCTKDMHFYSQKPAGEAKLFMSPKLKKILSGASEQ